MTKRVGVLLPEPSEAVTMPLQVDEDTPIVWVNTITYGRGFSLVAVIKGRGGARDRVLCPTAGIFPPTASAGKLEQVFGRLASQFRDVAITPEFQHISVLTGLEVLETARNYLRLQRQVADEARRTGQPTRGLLSSRQWPASARVNHPVLHNTRSADQESLFELSIWLMPS